MKESMFLSAVHPFSRLKSGQLSTRLFLPFTRCLANLISTSVPSGSSPLRAPINKTCNFLSCSPPFISWLMCIWNISWEFPVFPSLSVCATSGLELKVKDTKSYSTRFIMNYLELLKKFKNCSRNQPTWLTLSIFPSHP